VLPSGATIAAARRALTDAFRAAGLDTPELDARVLVGHALGLDHGALAAASIIVEVTSVVGTKLLLQEKRKTARLNYGWLLTHK